MTDIEKQVALRILKDGEIASSEVRQLLATDKRIVLTKTNFPNIRHLLCSYMTAYRRGMFRGGMQWVSVITPKTAEARTELEKITQFGSTVETVV